jgi:hypothetical protein
VLIARSKAVAEAKKKAKKKNAKGVLSPRTAADKAEKAVPMPALAFGIKGNETKEQQLAWAKPGGATVGASAKYAMPTGAMVAVGAGTHEEEEEEEDVCPSSACAVCVSSFRAIGAALTIVAVLVAHACTCARRRRTSSPRSARC